MNLPGAGKGASHHCVPGAGRGVAGGDADSIRSGGPDGASQALYCGAASDIGAARSGRQLRIDGIDGAGEVRAGRAAGHVPNVAADAERARPDVCRSGASRYRRAAAHQSGRDRGRALALARISGGLEDRWAIPLAEAKAPGGARVFPDTGGRAQLFKHFCAFCHIQDAPAYQEWIQ